MDIVLTLVVNPSQHGILKTVQQSLETTLGESITSHKVLSDNRAIDYFFDATSLVDIEEACRAQLKNISGLDWCIQEASDKRRKKLLIADMDSTMITVECIDELADFVGLKDKVSHITEAAMRGELNFEAALRERVALLKGLNGNDLQTCFDERISLMSGAKSLVRTMRQNGAFTALVSGGFTFFTRRVADIIGFDDNRANRLEMENNQLTGKVIEPICGAATKREALLEYCTQQAINISDALAVGDGANDIPMINAAGLGVAYHAKPKTAAAAKAAVNYGDLTTLLFYQGYHEEEFAH